PASVSRLPERCFVKDLGDSLEENNGTGRRVLCELLQRCIRYQVNRVRIAGIHHIARPVEGAVRLEAACLLCFNGRIKAPTAWANFGGGLSSIPGTAHAVMGSVESCAVSVFPGI